jgi:Family of unknown function (DUF6527)
MRILAQKIKQKFVKLFRAFGGWFSSGRSKKNAAKFRFVQVEDFPDTLKPKQIYVAGETGNYWGAALLCPCGCGETIQLNLLKDVRPCWTMKQHSDGSVTLLPSIWRQKGCKSHFFVRNGEIEWS